MAGKEYGGNIRLEKALHDRVSKAADACGQPVMRFVTDALEDVLAGLEAESQILPRCIAKRKAHGSDPVVISQKQRNAAALNEHFGKFGRKLAVDSPTKKKTKKKTAQNVQRLEQHD